MLLEMKGVNAGYDKIKVLRNVDISVKPNEIVALIGPNGAGKSTVIKSIFSIAKVTKGKIFYKGTDITDLKTHELMEMGISYVTQGRINFSNLTVRENLEIGADLIHDDKVIQKNLKMVYKKFPVLAQRKDESAYGLSGGQQQMLALGRALMQNPTVLMLDEPSLGLSPLLQKEIFETIKSLRDDGIAILIVEQNAKKAIEMADKTYLLENGEIALKGGREIIKNKKIKNIYLGGT